jgi:hypothetical protein
MVNARVTVASRGADTVAKDLKQGHDRSGTGVAADRHMPSTEHENPSVPEPSDETTPRWREPQGVQKGIADADKKARTGSTDETVRNVPPAGAWNETSKD